MKYKHEPQNRRMKALLKERGVKVGVRAIGFDAGESHRNRPSTDAWAENWYPLMEWGWRRAECVNAIKRYGITQPGKSSCFFCPAMKRGEILRLKDEQPELLQRALAMEANAKTKGSIKGLGGSLRWADLVSLDGQQTKLWDVEGWADEADPLPEGYGVPCGCYDG